MKTFLKNNILIILIIIVVSIIFITGGYKSLQEYKGYVNAEQQLIKECEREGTNQKEWCEEVIKNKDVELDFYTVFADTLTWQVQYINYFAFLIVVVPTMIKVCKILKNKQIINSNSRESYHAFLKKLLKTAYQYIWVLALLSLIMMIPIMMNTSLNPEYAMEEEIRQLHSVLTEIREKLHARRKNAYMLYSKLPPTIPPQQFSDILLDSGIILEKPQIVALIKKYTNGDMRNFVWQSFCDDCERCTLIGGRY